MKRIILSTVVYSVVFSASAFAQTAVLHSDGSQELRVTDASGKVNTVTVAQGESVNAKYQEYLRNQRKTPPAPEAKNQEWVSHEAVLLHDGSQEIHMTDPSGKLRVITAQKGESVQAKYWEFLKKEGIPCNCSPAGKTVEIPKTATRPENTKN